MKNPKKQTAGRKGGVASPANFKHSPARARQAGLNSARSRVPVIDIDSVKCTYCGTVTLDLATESKTIKCAGCSRLLPKDIA